MPRGKRMFFRKWFDKNFVISKKCVTRQNSGVASRRLQNHAELNKARSRPSTRFARRTSVEWLLQALLSSAWFWMRRLATPEFWRVTHFFELSTFLSDT